MLIALVSNVTLLVWFSNYAQCWLPCARLNPVARIPWAPSTAQMLKITLIEWLLKLTLLALHQVFTPFDFYFKNMGLVFLHFQFFTEGFFFAYTLLMQSRILASTMKKKKLEKKTRTRKQFFNRIDWHVMTLKIDRIRQKNSWIKTTSLAVC